jgi:DNA invertase Pin-like site-specific DNA recombinase
MTPDHSGRTLRTDEQISQLSKVAAEHRWTVTHVFTDCQTSVKKGQDRRPGELALIGAIRSGAIDRVLIWSIDRVGKCLVDLIGFIEICRSAHVALNLYDEGFDSETSNGLSLFDVSALSGAPPATIAAGSHIARTGRGSRSVDQVWQAADRKAEG